MPRSRAGALVKGEEKTGVGPGGLKWNGVGTKVGLVPAGTRRVQYPGGTTCLGLEWRRDQGSSGAFVRGTTKWVWVPGGTRYPGIMQKWEPGWTQGQKQTQTQTLE